MQPKHPVIIGLKQISQHTVRIHYFKTFWTLDQDSKSRQNAFRINLAKMRNWERMILFWQWAAKFEIWLLGSLIGISHCHRRNVFYQLWKQQPQRSNFPLSWHACLLLPDKCDNSYTSYSTPLLSRTFHMFMKRTLLIIGQVMPGSTQPWHDNPIRWEDPGRRYGRNGVEISLPWNETHFLMHNKAFILSAVTRKVFVGEGASWS